ncbi:MAG: OadG family protein [Nitrospinaceae bacterium]|nr:MAG: OadG family protein [Nitrospinaceae bacterium]
MSPDVISAIYVSLIAMGIIFLVLSILIITIKALEKLIPYKAPPPPPAKKQAAPADDLETEAHVAAIASALTQALGRSPAEINIVRIDRA